MRAAADEPIEVVERHVGIAETRKMLGQLIADRGQQIERHARGGHAHEIGVAAPNVVQLPRAQPAGGLGGMVEIVTELLDLHRIAVSDAGDCRQGRWAGRVA